MPYNPNDYENHYPGDTFAQERPASLQISFMNKVYALMTLGLMITAVLAHYLAFNIDPRTLHGIMLPCMIVELIVVLVLSAAVTKLPPIAAVIGFIGYAALNAVALSSIFLVYQIGSITSTFLSTALTFGVMSAYGMCTKRDLSTIGHYCCMAVLGLLIAGIVNIFLKCTVLELCTSVLGILIFTGLTAYDTQKLKNIQMSGMNHTGLAVLGALQLYLDFINLFLYLLRFMGRRK